MSTATLHRNAQTRSLRGPVFHAALIGAGLAFVAEALTGPFVESHVAYHSLNAVLNLALVVASVRMALGGRAAVGWAGSIGGWATALMALVAGAGGVSAVLVEGLTSATIPGLIEGIAHTTVLASLLFLVPLGFGLRHLDSGSGLVVAASSACLVIMVIAGLDQPGWFLAPEACLGLGFVMLARSLSGGDRS